ncbi:MAG: hypothetical protein A2469_00505 [Candidatus Magasanikbacteria bacterium RIFOXYC2_FULL_40_16]|uniref:Disease resistance R13L4/SHOC-2-like LRR domain-containing protein n=1 Tax=Candidatus Magasanikbacteria bacterium RIFOXYC2_FULL_40_16 TaxID=1798703 RepID=A0A1F6P1P5_9BACT|nr:MAG: hypothetical protein A2469_00505 [Candidatus Magasanikbacteria bacterium RIFOXYC2_FULL_40_16]
MKKLIFFILTAGLFVFGFLVLRGPGDTWACKNGEWIKFGDLNKTAPEKTCGIVDTVKGNVLTYTEDFRVNCRLLNTKRYGGKNLDEVPPELLFMQDVIVVELNDNRLSSLPKEFFALEKMRELYLDHNEFVELPAGLGDLSNLEVLDASHNRLKTIPKEIGKLTKLRKLDLSRNNLKELPEEFYSLKDSLKKLDIVGNDFDVDILVALQEKMPNTSINF